MDEQKHNSERLKKEKLSENNNTEIKNSNNFESKSSLKNENKKSFYTIKDYQIKTNNKEINKVNITKDNDIIEKATSSFNNIALISADFVNDNDKYMEEYIQLKKLAKLEIEKISLPSITPKMNLDKNSTANEMNKELDIEKKFQLRGLVHEKEDFLTNSFKKPNKMETNKIQFIRTNNLYKDSEHNFKRSFNKFDNRNYNKRNTFNGRIKGRTWKFNYL